MADAPTQTAPQREGGKDDPGHIPARDLAWPFPLPNPRLDRHGKPRKGEDPVLSPYVEIVDNDGTTPPNVFWHSPDIWVTSSQGINMPVTGEPNQIYARVHNRGLLDAGAVTVRFYAADPSAAITEQTVVPIGGSLAGATVTGVFIPGVSGPGQDSHVVVPCPAPWFPAALTHQCLLAKAWYPGQDPNSAPFEPILDAAGSRYSAQRNVHVTVVQAAKTFTLLVDIANFSDFALPVEVLIHAVPFEQAAKRVKRLRIALKHELVRPWRDAEIFADFDEESRFLRHGPATFGRMLVAAEDQRRRAAPDRTDAVIRLGDDLLPFERRKLRLEGLVPDTAQPGEVFAYDISQVLGGIPTGGYSGLFVVGG